MKDCVFQYATNSPLEIIENTALITRSEGERLWEKYSPVFIRHLEDGMEPDRKNLLKLSSAMLEQIQPPLLRVSEAILWNDWLVSN